MSSIKEELRLFAIVFVRLHITYHIVQDYEQVIMRITLRIRRQLRDELFFDVVHVSVTAVIRLRALRIFLLNSSPPLFASYFHDWLLFCILFREHRGETFVCGTTDPLIHYCQSFHC